MSGPLSRPTTREMFVASRDALDVAEEIHLGVNEIRKQADVLFAYPADCDARVAARLAARRVIALCDEMERLQGPSPVVNIETWRKQ